jgi:hypothetical protein
MNNHKHLHLILSAKVKMKLQNVLQLIALDSFIQHVLKLSKGKVFLKRLMKNHYTLDVVYIIVLNVVLVETLCLLLNVFVVQRLII